MNRLEALQLIGDIGGQDGEYQPAPLDEESAARPSRKRSRVGGGRSRAPDAKADDNDDEGIDTEALTTPTRKKRRGGSRKKQNRRAGDLNPEVSNSVAIAATRHRKRLRAEIVRAYGIGFAWGLSKADREALIAEQNYSRGVDVGAKMNDAGEGGEGDGQGEDVNGGSDPDLLPEKDALPLLPLFSEPSERLEVLYDEVESVLEDREETWTAVEDAHAELQDARRRYREALEEDALIKAALEEVKGRTRAAEMEEPCWWNDMMQRLRDFRSAYGHVKIPHFLKVDREADPAMYELSRFDLALKDRYRRGTLQRYPQRVKACEELGFNWGIQKDNYMKKLGELRSYKLKHGHCEVRTTDDIELYKFVCGVRARHRARLSGKRYSSEEYESRYDKNLAILREILGGQDALEEWIRPLVRGQGRHRVGSLRQHREKTGHCVHPDPAMRRWVAKIRAKYRRKKEGRLYPTERMSDDIINSLNRMGFCWGRRCTCEGAPEGQGQSDDDVSSSSDSEGEEDLHDTADLEAGSEDHQGLVDAGSHSEKKRTLSRQKRRAMKKNSQRRSDKAWSKWIEKLKSYKVENGHCLVKRTENEKLHDWLRAAQISYGQFQKCRSEKADNGNVGDDDAETKIPMSEARACELEEVMGRDKINAILDRSEPSFDAMFKRWKEHKDKEGNCMHPDREVRNWLSYLKVRHRTALAEKAKQKKGGTENSASSQDAASADALAGEKRKKWHVPLSPRQFKLLDDAGVCWVSKCVCADSEKKAALAMAGEEAVLRSKYRSFDERLREFREHKEKTGHCVHPDPKMRNWFVDLKGKRRATLEKRARDKRGDEKENADGDTDDEGQGAGDEDNKSTKEPKNAERKKKSGSCYKPLSDEVLAKIEDLDVCWGRGCRCRSAQPDEAARVNTPCLHGDDAKKMAALAARAAAGERGGRPRKCRSFYENLNALKQHKKQTGHCIHPDPSVRDWFTVVKGRRRATLEKRARNAEGDEKELEVSDTGGGDQIAESEASEDDELTRKLKAVKKRKKGGRYRPLSKEMMDSIENLDFCWGRGCQCRTAGSDTVVQRSSQTDTTVQKTAASLQPLSFGGSLVKDSDPDKWSFDDMLAFFCMNRSVNGWCYSAYPQMQQWYMNTKMAYTDQKRNGKGDLTDMQIAALEVSGVCLEQCFCLSKRGDSVSQESERLQADKEKETSVTKTVAALDRDELGKLAMEVIAEVRKRECWSDEECFSDDSSSGDDSSFDAGEEVDEEKESMEKGEGHGDIGGD